jgi:uncharacterized SAM-binding protein YcdF (DUF218 family)
MEESALMFFVVSKTVPLLLLPSNFLILIGAVGVVLLVTRWRRIGAWLAGISIVLLLTAGFLPVGKLLIHSLESRFPKWDRSRGAPDGVIVLGGAIIPELSSEHSEPVLNDDAGRIVALAKLAHDYPNARIVYSGGEGALIASGHSEAQFLTPLLKSLNLSPERVLLESRSRNTAENATFTKEMVKPKSGERWLLVTSAWHIPRAIGCFRRIGFSVEAYPVAWRSGSKFEFWPRKYLSGGLEEFDLGVHEWMGLIAYWLSGRTSALFPSP